MKEGRGGLGKLFEGITVYHRRFFDDVENFVGMNSKKLRLKDFARFLHFCSYFRYDSANSSKFDVFQIAIDAFRDEKRFEERKKYGKTLCESLEFLAVARRFPTDLISYATSEDFLSSVSNASNIHPKFLKSIIYDLRSKIFISKP